MRLRIVHQLWLLIAAIVLIAAAATGALLAWNLKTGFSDYQRARDERQLQRFIEVAGEYLADAATGRGPFPMRELMDETLRREGVQPPQRRREEFDAPPPPPPRRDGYGPPPRGEGYGPPGRDGYGPPGRDGYGPPGREGFDPPPAAAPPPPQQQGRGGPPDGLGRRIEVLDLQGRHLGGPQLAGDHLVQRPLVRDGQTIAWVRMAPLPQQEDVDRRFLQRQYAGLGATLAVTLVLALLAGWWAGRRIAAPVETLRAATHRIARGELSVSVPEGGAREIADLIADVNGMAASLQRLEGARRRWIAQVAHELRTPLSVLLGELESVQDGARRVDGKLVALLRDEVLHLVRMVEDLHTLSVADMGSLPCRFEPVHVADLVTRAADLHASRLANARLALERVAGADRVVEWDPVRIQQLLGNLLENSLRYTASPGIVRIGWTAEGGQVLLWVEDSAPGVPAALLEQIFDPLFRVDTARTRSASPGGTGLGLAICRAIVQAHGGTVVAVATPLGGLRIEARLPVQAQGDGR